MDLDSSFSGLFLSKDSSDVGVIVEGDKNFPAHSLVLKRRSPVIKTMLESDFVEGQEAQDQTIVITDCKATHVEMFLKFLYTDIVPEMYSGLCELVKIAHKYDVSKLTEKCEESLFDFDFVNLQNVYELCELADLYSLKKLRDKCMNLIKRAAFKLLKSDDLKSLSKELMKKIVGAEDLNVIKEIDVFWAIWRWGELQFRYRGMVFSTQLTTDLLKDVRWNLTNAEDKENTISWGVYVDDADLKKKWKARKPSADDTQWFLNQCDMLRVDNNAASRVMLVGDGFSSQVTLMRALSLSEKPFYVVGVLFLAHEKNFKNDISLPLKCSCGSSSSVTERWVQVEKSVVIANPGKKTTSQETIMSYAEIMFEFPKPVEVCKNQTLLIEMRSALGTSFGGIRLTIDRQVTIRSQKGRDISVNGDVIGIKKVFML